jgi:2-oxoglutarate ferredoxin oxidoreductase subunit delta
MSQETVTKKKKGVVEIKAEWCKGCAICVEFCPEQVLIMERGKAKVASPELCTACNMCELRCPDFCITVTAIKE